MMRTSVMLLAAYFFNLIIIILMSSVCYRSTDALQNGVYLLNRYIAKFNIQLN